MAYDPKTWVDGRDGGTPVNAAALNEWEARIYLGVVSASSTGVELVSPGTVTTNQTLDMTTHEEVLWIVTVGANVKLEIGGWATGKTVMLVVKQDAAGGRSVGMPTAKWDGGAIPVGSTDPAAIDIRAFFRGLTETYAFESGTGMA